MVYFDQNFNKCAEEDILRFKAKKVNFLTLRVGGGRDLVRVSVEASVILIHLVFYSVSFFSIARLVS
jgi:hypothetical protein